MVPVDKTNRTIKAILAKTAGDGWRGREVYVEEVDPSWSYEGVRWDPNTYPRDRVFQVHRDAYLGDTYINFPDQGRKIDLSQHLAVVTFGVPEPITAKPSHQTVTIFIPQLDHVQLDVARDALLAGNKSLDTLLKPFGYYAGIARAILERQVRSFTKAMHPKKSTKQIRREVDDFPRSQGRL